MKRLSTLIFAALLAGCASTVQPPPPPPAALFNDTAFAQPAAQFQPADIFKLSPEMVAYAQKVRQTLLGRNVHEALFEALYRRDQLQLDYDSAQTRTAAEAFAARSGNCMSLVIMTAALARELGLKVQFQRVAAGDAWSRNGSLYFNAGHVNVRLAKPDPAEGYSFDRAHFLTIDFLPPPDAESLLSEPLSEATIVAMFMNNRAAETMVQGKLDEAYWWARQSVSNAPDFILGYNTLATIYQRHGDMERAERVLRFAHQREPDNTVILFNLAEVTRAMGRTEEAARLKTELARLEPHPPFHFFNQGRKAMQDGDYAAARALFAREVQRDPYYHEFHFWLAKAAFAQGDLAAADKHMNMALSTSTTRGDSELYAGKLANLRLYESRSRLRPGYAN